MRADGRADGRSGGRTRGSAASGQGERADGRTDRRAGERVRVGRAPPSTVTVHIKWLLANSYSGDHYPFRGENISLRSLYNGTRM